MQDFILAVIASIQGIAIATQLVCALRQGHALALAFGAEILFLIVTVAHLGHGHLVQEVLLFDIG
jgi:hypothetical protein